MSSGRSKKLVGQAGEYLVAGELARRGYIATTFTGNVPHFDIVASNEAGQHASVQVKTISGASWQFTITTFCDIEFVGDQQVVGATRPAPVKNLICVLVMLVATGSDRYFIMTWDDLASITAAAYRTWLATHDGVRPKKATSLHCAMYPRAFAAFEDNWDLISKALD